MKNQFLLLAILIMFLFTSCSKEVIENTETLKEIKSEQQGLSISNEAGFNADYVSFKLRQGSKVISGNQTTKTFNYQKLNEGVYMIFQVKVYKNYREIPFSAYTFRDGERGPVKGTSVVRIKKNELFKIYITK